MGELCQRSQFHDLAVERLATMFTVLWDNDGVLVDTEGLYFRATQTVLATVGIHLTPEQFIDISLRQGQSTFKLAAEQGIPVEAIACLRAERDRLYVGFLQTEPCLINGVGETLRSLHGRVRMGVVTSTRRQHFEIAHARTGLGKYLDFVVTLEDYRHSKPNPEPYLTAMSDTAWIATSASWSKTPSEGWRRRRRPGWSAWSSGQLGPRMATSARLRWSFRGSKRRPARFCDGFCRTYAESCVPGLLSLNVLHPRCQRLSNRNSRNREFLFRRPRMCPTAQLSRACSKLIEQTLCHLVGIRQQLVVLHAEGIP